MKHKCKFTNPQLVKFRLPDPNYALSFPFKDGDLVMFLGEIKQMPGHCVIANRLGKIYWGYHTSNFIEPNKDEI
jgi:hypothetical protein